MQGSYWILILSIVLGFIISFFIVKKLLLIFPLVLALTLPGLILIPLDYLVPLLVAVGLAIQAGVGIFFFRIAGIGTYPLELLLFISLTLLTIEILLKKRDLPLRSIFFWLFIPFLLYNIILLFVSLELINEGRDISYIRVTTHNFLSYLVVFVFLAYFDSVSKLRAYFYASMAGLLLLSIIIISPLIPGFLSLIPMMARGRIYMQNVGLMAFWYPFMFQYFNLTKKTSERFLIVITFIFSAVALILSQYRTSWIGVFLALFVSFILNFFLLQREKRIGFVIRVFLLLILGVLGGILIFRVFLPREFSAILTFLQKRVLSFKFLRYDPALLSRRIGVYESKAMFKDSPIFGNGFGIGWTFVGHKVGHVDNLYWQALVQYGILGSLFFFLPFLVWGYEIIYILLNLKRIKDPLIFSLAMAVISFYLPFFIMHTTMAHLLIAPAIIVIALSFIALTDFIYRNLKEGGFD
ncbi:MAG: O-antigen ligase family protein [bacterium]